MASHDEKYEKFAPRSDAKGKYEIKGKFTNFKN